MMKLFPIIAIAMACACTPAERQKVETDAELAAKEAAKDAVGCILEHTDVFASSGAAEHLATLCGPLVTAEVAASTITAFYQAKTAAGAPAKVTIAAEGGAS